MIHVVVYPQVHASCQAACDNLYFHLPILMERSVDLHLFHENENKENTVQEDLSEQIWTLKTTPSIETTQLGPCTMETNPCYGVCTTENKGDSGTGIDQQKSAQEVFYEEPGKTASKLSAVFTVDNPAMMSSDKSTKHSPERDRREIVPAANGRSCRPVVFILARRFSSPLSSHVQVPRSPCCCSGNHSHPRQVGLWSWTG